MKKAILIVLASSLVFSTMALASGSSGGSGVPSGGGSVDPYKVTEMMKCVVTEIKPDGTIMVRDSKTEKVHPLALKYNTKLSAQDKKAFDGRKELKAADLAVGQVLKVTARQVNGEVLRVKILKST